MKAGLLVVGTDDGLIQVTRDGGKSWTKTDHFPGVPDTTYVSRVVFSRANEGTIYATLDGHRSNDFKPYVMKSVDFGKTWASISADLPDGGSVQVIREHPRQPNLLFVGTEFGVFATIDGGAHWTQLKSGIPGVPVHDLQIQARMERSRRRHARPRRVHPRRSRAARASRAGEAGAGRVHVSDSRRTRVSSRTRRATREWGRADSRDRIRNSARTSRTC